jgi:uncharacterized protein
MSRSSNLMRLQTIDSQIQKILNRIEEIEKLLSDNSALLDSEKQVSKIESHLAESQKILRQTEKNVKEQQLKIEKTNVALYGGKIQNPKELQDLQNEAASLRRYLNVLEDRQIEAMISLEDAESQHRLAINNYEEIKVHQQRQNEKLSEELAHQIIDLKRLNVEREVVIQTIDINDLEIYEKLRNNRRGLAIASIVDLTCSACGTTLTPAIRQSSQSPAQIVQCPSCRRILYPG